MATKQFGAKKKESNFTGSFFGGDDDDGDKVTLIPSMSFS
jgi:hypothetical protein